MGKQIIVKRGSEITLEDAKSVDLIVSVGGDSTYLQSSSFAYDSSLPILGINS